MRTKLFLLTLLIITSAGLINKSIAQSQYEICYQKDSLHISGKWVNSKKSNPESPLELRLKIENTDMQDIEFSYEIALYMNSMLREKTEKDTFKIKAGKVKMGKLNGVRFMSATLSNEEILSDQFSWEISVEKVE